jgi:hypothetical protein
MVAIAANLSVLQACSGEAPIEQAIGLSSSLKAGIAQAGILKTVKNRTFLQWQ